MERAFHAFALLFALPALAGCGAAERAAAPRTARAPSPVAVRAPSPVAVRAEVPPAPAPDPAPAADSGRDDASDDSRVAAVVAAAQAGDVDDFARADGWTLWSARGLTVICPESEGACFELPTPRRVERFDCRGPAGPCALSVENDTGAMEEWEFTFTAGHAQRRLARTWADEPTVLAGPQFTNERRARGAAVPLVEFAARPSGVDAAAFRDHEPVAGEPARRGSSPCRLQVSSLRDGGVILRVVTCAAVYPDGSRALASVVVDRAGHSESTPVFTTELGRLERVRASAAAPLVADALAPGAVAFLADESDDGSPGGTTEVARWVVVPATATRGARAHRLVVGSVGTIGLGAGGRGEGYVVGVHRMRATVAWDSAPLLRYVSCERWDGEHARESDRWRGARRVEPLDLALRFDVERGFELSDADRETFVARCGAPQ